MTIAVDLGHKAKNEHQLFSFPRTCWIKIEVFHWRERWCTFVVITMLFTYVYCELWIVLCERLRISPGSSLFAKILLKGFPVYKRAKKSEYSVSCCV